MTNPTGQGPGRRRCEGLPSGAGYVAGPAMTVGDARARSLRCPSGTCAHAVPAAVTVRRASTLRRQPMRGAGGDVLSSLCRVSDGKHGRGRNIYLDDAEFLTATFLLCRLSAAFRHKFGKAEGGLGPLQRLCRISDIKQLRGEAGQPPARSPSVRLAGPRAGRASLGPLRRLGPRQRHSLAEGPAGAQHARPGPRGKWATSLN